MSERTTPLYKGEPHVFPTFGFPDGTDEAAFYRCSADVDRTLDQYNDAFGFDFRKFVGRTVLDLGSGRNAQFARDAQAAGVHVVALNPNWGDDAYRVSESGGKWYGEGADIAAVAQELPFADESFDAIVSLWGVPTYLPGTYTEYRRAFDEIQRVLKPEGVAMLFPISRMTVKQPAFEEVLAESFPHYWLLNAEEFPKLFVAKSVTPNNIFELTDLAVAMNRRTPNYFF